MNEETPIEEFIFDTGEAMDAAYRVLIEDEDIETVLENSKYLVVFPFNILDYNEEDIEDMLQHYVEREEYGKCIILRDYYKNKGHGKNNNRRI